MPKLSDIFQNVTHIVESLTDNHKDPLHVGEVMACWTYLAFVSNIVTYEQVAVNIVTDTKLNEVIKDALKVAKDHKKQLSEFMISEGIPLPSLPEDKPGIGDPSSIPAGAKLSDDEIVNTLIVNFVAAANMCAASASQCLRNDVGFMFLRYQTDKLSLGFKTKELMQKKGWLKVPPYYYPPGGSPTSS